MNTKPGLFRDFGDVVAFALALGLIWWAIAVIVGWMR
jgi:hypothetical protein